MITFNNFNTGITGKNRPIISPYRGLLLYHDMGTGKQ